MTGLQDNQAQQQYFWLRLDARGVAVPAWRVFESVILGSSLRLFLSPPSCLLLLQVYQVLEPVLLEKNKAEERLKVGGATAQPHPAAACPPFVSVCS